MNKRRIAQRGVTLIEALVALVVMAIGMLGLVGVQTTLRANSDIAKQRSEAIRMAQQKVEEFRGFAQLPASSAASPYFGYGDLADGTDTLTGNNASYTRVWQAWDLDASMKGKTLKVAVGWSDRAASSTAAGVPIINQTVTLTTVIAGIAPELSATLAVPGEGDTLRRPVGRNRNIPMAAKDLGNGTSGFIPPGSSGVAWVFNNATGVIRLCTVAVTVTTSNDITDTNTTCSNDYALLVAGFVDYSLGGNGPSYSPPSSTNFDALVGSRATEANSLIVNVHQTSPGSLAADRLCFTEIVDAAALAYYCAPRVILVSGSPSPWSGWITFDYPTSSPRIENDLSDDHDDRRKVCRFKSAPTYATQRESLLNQNYLVIRSGNGHTPFTCPTSPTTYFHDSSNPT